MALVQLELDIANQAMDLIGAAPVTLANQSTVEGERLNRNYAQTRDALIRSFEWPFARTRQILAIIQTIEIQTKPKPDAWAAGDTIFGLSSGASAEILTVTDETHYEIGYLDGTFEDAETITNATVSTLYYEGVVLTYAGETLYYFDSSLASQVVCATGYPVIANSTPSFGYAYQYMLPSDMNRFQRMWWRVNRSFSIEGKRLLTDDDKVDALYIKNVTDTTQFDDLFIEVLILRLALKMLPSVAGSGTSALNFRQDLKQDLRAAESKARIVCQTEENDSGNHNWGNARYTTGTGFHRGIDH
jgi:hypothetical protein